MPSEAFYKLFIDEEICTGCGACVIACMDQNDTDPDNGDPPLRWLECKGGPYPHFISATCRHCVNAPCIAVCPRGAIFCDSATGCVTVEEEKCLGCRQCVQACPYSVPQFKSSGQMQKCDGCSQRRKAGLLPACFKVCPVGAIKHQ